MELRSTLCQLSLRWEDRHANTRHIDDLLQRSGPDTDLILLPELFSTGFTMSVDALAESMEGTTVSWMRDAAARYEALVAGSVIIRESEKTYNRMVVAGSNGPVAVYDKRHLFRMGEENEHYSMGARRVVFGTGEWRVCPLVCYDLRFPVWSRNRNEYDLLVYVANWPAVRHEVWKTLLKARAVENSCYVIGVNRVGTDGRSIAYDGGSMVVDFKGRIVSELGNGEEIRTVSLDLETLRAFRRKFPVLLDADDYEVI